MTDKRGSGWSKKCRHGLTKGHWGLATAKISEKILITGKNIDFFKKYFQILIGWQKNEFPLKKGGNLGGGV